MDREITPEDRSDGDNPRADHLRTAIIGALEDFEGGDPSGAVAALLSVLEDGPTERPYRCEYCGLTAAWAGELTNHRRFVHGDAV